jgi:hypothetical protein
MNATVLNQNEQTSISRYSGSWHMKTATPGGKRWLARTAGLLTLAICFAVANLPLASAADANAKGPAPAALLPQPVVPVKVVEGNVNVTGVVEVSNAVLPVSVQGDVPVTGVVEVLNDSLYQPFIREASASFPADVGGVDVDIPNGKRLIVETLAVQVRVPAGQKVRVFLQIRDGITPILGVVPVQSPGPFLGAEYYIGNHPFKLCADAVNGLTNEISISMARDLLAGNAHLLVTV